MFTWMFLLAPLTHASLAHEISRHELPASTQTAICEARLAAGRATDTSRAIDKFREFRLRVLDAPVVEPGYSKNLRVTSDGSAADRQLVAAQIRDLERWTKDASDRRLAGSVAAGSGGIEAYQSLRESQLAVIHQAQTSFAKDAHFRASMVALRTLGAGIATLPVVGFQPLLLVSYLAFDPWAAFAWRFDRDRLREDADLAIATFSNRSPEDQVGAWAYSSRAYRVSRRTIAALWSGDSSTLVKSVTRDLYESSWYVNRYLWQPLRDIAEGLPVRKALNDHLNGWIIVDELIHWNTKEQRPELVIAVRTTSRRRAKSSQRRRVPAVAKWLAPVTAR